MLQKIAWFDLLMLQLLCQVELLSFSQAFWQKPIGVLYVDELNLLDEGIFNLMLAAFGAGENQVEREGLSLRHACKPLLIATYNPEEGGIRDHLLDRFAIVLSADQLITNEQRVEITQSVLAHGKSSATFAKKWE